MAHPTQALPQTTIGLDVGDRFTHVCVLNHDGEVARETRLPTTPNAFNEFFCQYAGARVVYEVGSHSPWITHQLRALGCETVVANPRKFKYIARSDRKNDRSDAEALARLARVDPKLLAPIKHRGLDTQAHRAVLRARDSLVRSRTRLINCLRGLVKPFGYRLPRSSTVSFHRKVADSIPHVLRPAATPLLQMLVHEPRDVASRQPNNRPGLGDCAFLADA